MDKKDILERVQGRWCQVHLSAVHRCDRRGEKRGYPRWHAWRRALEDGVWFDGSSVEGFARIQESDMRLILDPDTYAVLPWTPAEMRRARFFCDIYQPDGTPFPGDPRGVLNAHC